MPSPTATKLRLLYQKSARAFDVAKAEREAAWLAYMKQMCAEGFCPACEKTLQECKCVFMAAMPESEGPISAPITSTETAEIPARQSGSPEVDPSGDRQ